MAKRRQPKNPPTVTRRQLESIHYYNPLWSLAAQFNIEPKVLERMMQRNLRPSTSLHVPARIERRVLQQGFKPEYSDAKSAWLPENIPDVKLWVKGRVPPLEVRRRIREIARGHAMYFSREYRPHRAPVIIEAMQRAFDAGISAERFLQAFPVGAADKRPEPTSVIVLTRRMGNALEMMPPERLRRLNLECRVPDLIAKVHRAGIAHGHPHFGNITLIARKLTLIDFSRAELPKVNWGEARELLETFLDDYHHLSIDFVHQFPNDAGIRERMFQRLVNQYPTTPAVKESLMKLLRKEFHFE